MLKRRILVTKVVNANGGTRLIYGRFDAVALASQGEKILYSEFKYYTMREEDFAKYGKEINHGSSIKV